MEPAPTPAPAKAFDEKAAQAAATAADPAAPAGGAPAPGAATAPATPAAPAHAGAQADVPLAAHAVVQYADQALWALTKRRAKKAGILPLLSTEDRAKLRFTEADKEELLIATPGVLPALAKYSDLIEKIGLGLFAFALWGIYEDKRDLVEKAAEIAKARGKGPVGFATQKEAAPQGPDPMRGIPPHGG